MDDREQAKTLNARLGKRHGDAWQNHALHKKDPFAIHATLSAIISIAGDDAVDFVSAILGDDTQYIVLALTEDHLIYVHRHGAQLRDVTTTVTARRTLQSIEVKDGPLVSLSSFDASEREVALSVLLRYPGLEISIKDRDGDVLALLPSLKSDLKP